MRACLVTFLTLAVSGGLAAQTTVRPARPGRVVTPRPAPQIPSLPPPGVTPAPGNSSGQNPVNDPRLGAGGVRGRSGNIVYPGTPGRSNTGSVVSPGIPSVPAVVQPVRRPRHGRGERPGRPVIPVYVPVYGMYGYAATPNVIEVNAETLAQSNAQHVIEVGEQTTAAEPAERSEEPDYWLIALRGGLIYAATEFGEEHRALWFVTVQGDEYVVPLAEVDAAFSRRLNQERGFEIELDLP